MNETVAVRATRDDVRRIVADFMAQLAGHGAGTGSQAVRGLQLRLGMVLLSQVAQDFKTKAQGGTGVDGIKWQPLSPRTIANRRFGPGEQSRLNKAAGVKNKGGMRPLLTTALDKEWRRIFGQIKASLVARGLDEGEAKRRAAATAWVQVKAMGGKTKLMVYGSRQVEILIDTAELERSFSPGADGNILRAEPGRVVVGTNKKTWHHRGTSRGLPSRPFWPLDGNLPAPYWEEILAEAKRGTMEALVAIMNGKT